MSESARRVVKLTAWLEFSDSPLAFAPGAREAAMRRAAVREIEAAQNGGFDGDHGVVTDYVCVAELVTEETLEQVRLRVIREGIHPYD